MDCLFCDIVSKKKESKMIYEDDCAVAILDVFPRAKGHTLLLPKRHMETILELEEGEFGLIMKALKNTTKLLKDKLSPQGFTIGINHGKVSGQLLEHLHIHIMPRYDNDGGGSMHSVINTPSNEPLEEIYKNIVSQ